MSELSEREIERLTTELRAAAAIAKRLSEAEDEIERLRTERDVEVERWKAALETCRELRKFDRAEIEKLRAAPVSEDELNLIKAFWRAEPSCMEQKCTDDCNPLTAHCGHHD